MQFPCESLLEPHLVFKKVLLWLYTTIFLQKQSFLVSFQMSCCLRHNLVQWGRRLDPLHSGISEEENNSNISDTKVEHANFIVSRTRILHTSWLICAGT